MARVPLVALSLLAGLMTTGFAVDQPPDLLRQTYYTQHMDWGDCGDGFQCATLEVPLDYAKPGKDRIALSVVRLPASGGRKAGRKIGSLLLNPGGPGGSGLDYARSAMTVVSARLRERFDIVGFDPRGVGDSAPVRCPTGPQLDRFLGLDPTPDTPAEIEEGEDAARQYARGCAARSGELLAHVGTPDAARDMDVLRAALGDDKLTYLGKSYGTYLGATYADLFPGKVRALVLDGALDPKLTKADISKVQARGFDLAFESFLRDCFTAKDCPFKARTVDKATAEATALLDGTDKTPLRNTADKRKVGEGIALTGLLYPLYDEKAWPYLRQALAAAFKGDGTILLRFADLYNGRRADGTYSNETEAHIAINCLDHPYSAAPTPPAPKSSLMGKYLTDGKGPCAYWPVKSTSTPRPLHAKGAAPIVVVGTIRDPATPYQWSRALASQLSSGRLLTFDGDGHTAYGRGSTCVDTLIDRYFLSLKPPPAGTTCPKV
ncbi:alpha/beta hydrolase [Sphaerisporangium corydalis]|uniref:Alpha/beta hydrolase n=1 Tax=Sphaerisporangium corydalis TaxID=1441875 RepID=A0ABV9ESM5_9ACTN|nr:alpha/beta hydrolase [Sphaerisporangium corydalis]